MATVFDKRVGSGAPEVDGLNREGIAKVRINTALTNIASGDSWKVWTIPAGLEIEAVDLITVVAEGAGDTVDVGDSAGQSQFQNDASTNGAVGAAVMGAATTRKYYHVADYIAVLANAALGTAVFDLLIHWKNVGAIPYNQL